MTEHGEAENHGGVGISSSPSTEHIGASHPLATAAMCLEMTYSDAKLNPA